MTWLQLFSQPETYISLATLTLLEVVLGIDNIIFVSILAGKLPEAQRKLATRLGLFVALFARFILLASIAWVVQLTHPWIVVLGHAFSGKDIILLSGGLFLVWKSVQEIYDKVEGHEHTPGAKTGQLNTLQQVVFQIVLVDMVFSIDSIITAVGLVNNISIMVLAVLISMSVMMLSAHKIGEFVDRHPSIKVLALSFLLMIGTLLVAEGFHVHVPKGYIYSSLVFALFVEVLNIRTHARKQDT